MTSLGIAIITISIFIIITFIFYLVISRKRNKSIIKSSLIFAKKNLVIFSLFILFFAASFSISLSSSQAANSINEVLYTSFTKGATPNFKISASYLYPSPEQYDPATGNYALLNSNRNAGSIGIYDYNQQLFDPLASIEDPTPDNLKDNSAYSNEHVWNYPTNTTDFTVGTEEYNNSVRHNQIPGSYYGYDYTPEFLSYSDKYPIMSIPGNEWLFSIMLLLEEFQIDSTESVGESLKPSNNFSQFFWDFEAKLKAEVLINGEKYWIEISTLSTPDENNSFKYNDDVYLINNFIDDSNNGGGINLEDDHIYISHGLSNKIGINSNSSITVSGSERNLDTGINEQYRLSVQDMGYSPEYIYPTSTFASPVTSLADVTFDNTSDEMIIGFVNHQTFYNIATKLYSNSQISESTNSSEISENRLIDYSFNLLTPNVILGLINDKYPNDILWDNSHYYEDIPGYNDIYGIYQISYGIPIDELAYSNRGYLWWQFRETMPFYFSFDNSYQNSPDSLFMSSKRVSTSFWSSQYALAIEQSSSYNAIANVSILLFLIISFSMTIFIVRKIIDSQKKQIGILKATGYKTIDISISISIPIFLSVVIASVFLILMLPLFNWIWWSIASSTTVLSLSYFALSIKSFIVYVLFPISVSVLVSILTGLYRTKEKSLNLINDKGGVKPGYLTVAMDKLNIKTNSFKTNYSLKGIFDKLTKSAIIISVIFMFSFSILASLSISRMTEETSQNVVSAFNFNSVSTSNKDVQYKSYTQSEFVEGDFVPYTFGLPSNLSDEIISEAQFNTLYSSALTYMNDTVITGNQYITPEAFLNFYYLVEIGYENDWGLTYSDKENPEYIYRWLSSLGYDPLSQGVITLGFEIVDEDSMKFQYEGKVNFKLNGNESSNGPQLVDIVNPTPVDPNTGGGNPVSNNPSSPIENYLVYFSKIGKNNVTVNIDSSNLLFPDSNLISVKVGSQTKDKTSSDWVVNGNVLSVTFNNLEPGTKYFVEYTYENSYGTSTISGYYVTTLSSDESVTAGGEIIESFSHNDSFELSTCGEIEYDPSEQICILPGDSTYTEVMTFTHVETILEIINWDVYDSSFDLNSFEEMTKISDGIVPVIVDSESVFSTGDVIEEVDLSDTGFFDESIPNSEKIMNPQFVVVQEIEMPLPLGIVVPIDDPDFANNTGIEDIENGTVTSKPVNANNGNLTASTNSKKQSDNLISLESNSGNLSLGFTNSNYVFNDSETLYSIDSVSYTNRFVGPSLKSTIYSFKETIANLELYDNETDEILSMILEEVNESMVYFNQTVIPYNSNFLTRREGSGSIRDPYYYVWEEGTNDYVYSVIEWYNQSNLLNILLSIEEIIVSTSPELDSLINVGEIVVPEDYNFENKERLSLMPTLGNPLVAVVLPDGFDSKTPISNFRTSGLNIGGISINSVDLESVTGLIALVLNIGGTIHENNSNYSFSEISSNSLTYDSNMELFIEPVFTVLVEGGISAKQELSIILSILIIISMSILMIFLISTIIDDNSKESTILKKMGWKSFESMNTITLKYLIVMIISSLLATIAAVFLLSSLGTLFGQVLTIFPVVISVSLSSVLIVLGLVTLSYLVLYFISIFRFDYLSSK